MNVKELIRKIETEFNNEWKGRRFEDIYEPHNSIFEILNKLLPNNLGLLISYWNVKVKSSFEDILKYKFDYNKDNRYKYEIRGRMNSIKISTSLSIDDNTTLEELINNVNKLSLENRIDMLKINLKEKQEELTNIKSTIEELNEKLKTFE